MTPQLRAALIQTGESLAITALITALASVTAVLTSNMVLNWSTIGILFAMSFLYSLVHGLAAYAKTLANPQAAQLGGVVDALIAALEARYPPLQGRQPTELQPIILPSNQPKTGPGQ